MTSNAKVMASFPGDAMRSHHIYQQAKSMGCIVDVFKKDRGQAFDPELLDIFLHVLNRR